MCKGIICPGQMKVTCPDVIQSALRFLLDQASFCLRQVSSMPFFSKTVIVLVFDTLSFFFLQFFYIYIFVKDLLLLFIAYH